MSDLAVKMFMADHSLTDFDEAKETALKFGLLDDYIPFANVLEPLLDDDDTDYTSGFMDGISSALEILRKVRFGSLDPSVPEEFKDGVETAARGFHMIMDQMEKFTLNNSEEAPESAIMPEIDPIARQFAKIFGESPSR